LPITTTCQHCGAFFNDISSGLVGKTVKCPKCGSSFRVEAQSLEREGPVETVCPHCQARYGNLKPEHLGKTAKCDKCGQRFRIEPVPRSEQDKVKPETSLTLALNADDIPDLEEGLEEELPGEASPDDESEARPGPAWAVGDVIMDLYKVTGFLGEGGMGKVFRVHHRGWNLNLAVKVPKTEVIRAAGGVDNFEREAETWVNLGLHPHIVSCYYVRRIHKLPLIFAEYVNGGSLQSWLKPEDDHTPRLYQGDPEQVLERILDIAIQFAWGLDYAHKQGLIHQDVKPANVMMTQTGIAKVTDFGLAIPRSQAEEMEESSGEPNGAAEGLVIGTPAYFAPEQSTGGLLTRKIDLWSWAVSMVEIFKGGRSWQSGTVVPEVLEEYVKSGPDQTYIPRMPDPLANLLRSCLIHNPDNRPPSMRAVAHRLVEIYEKVTRETYTRPEPKAGGSVADNLNNMAISLMDLGRKEEAERLWEESLKSQPHHPESTYSHGLVLWRSARMTDETLAKQMEEVLRSHPEDWINHYLLGLVHLESDDCSEALKIFESIPESDARLKELKPAMEYAQACLPGSRKLLRTFEGHTANVNSVYLSRDGLSALSGSDDRTLRLWEVETGRCVRTFEGSEGAVNAVCFSRDRHYALSGSGDYTRSDFSVRLWEVSSGLCLRIFEGHEASVNAVCLDGSGRLAFSGGDEGIVKLWEVETGRLIRNLQGHRRSVTSIDLINDRRHVLSGSGDKTIRLWESDTGRCLRTFEGHEGPVTSIALSDDGKYVLSGSADNTLKLWETASARLVRTFTGHSDEVTSVSMTPEGRHAVSGGFDNTVRLWELDTGRCWRTFLGHKSWVLSISVSRNGEYALSGDVSGAINYWRTSCSARPEPSPLILSKILTSEAVLTAEINYENHLDRAQKYLEQEDLPRAAAEIREARAQKGYARRAEAMKAWTDLYARLPHQALAGGWEEASLEGHESWIRSVVTSQNGKLALSGGADGALKLWDLFSKRCQRTFEGHKGGVLAVCLSRDNAHAFSGGADQTLKLWDTGTASCLLTLEGHEASVNAVCLSQDGLLGLSGSEDRTVKVWDLATGRCLRTLEGHRCAINSIRFGLDDQYVLSGSGDHTLEENVLKLWDLAAGRCLCTLEGHEGVVYAVALNHDYRYAFSGSGDTTLKMWDITAGECIRTFKGHTQAVNTICLSQDERYILSGSSDNTLKIWEVTTGRCLRTFEGHTASVSSASLSHDGRYIVSGGEDNILKIWLLDWELEGRELSVWDEGALSYLETFLTMHIPYAAELPREGEVSDEEVTRRLTRQGTTAWSDDDFQGLLDILGWAGYGWLRPEGIKISLQYLARRWQGAPELEIKEEQPEAPLRKKSPQRARPGLTKRLLTGIKGPFAR